MRNPPRGLNRRKRRALARLAGGIRGLLEAVPPDVARQQLADLRTLGYITGRDASARSQLIIDDPVGWPFP
jgi:hypothetical protein